MYFYFESVILKSEEYEEYILNLKSVWRRYGPYIIVDILFVLAWSLVPSLALVYFVPEWLKGNMFHIALIEAMISTAILTGTYIVDKISGRKAFQALQIRALTTITGLSLMVSTNFFPLVLLALYVVRIGYTFVFIFKRTWLYSIITRKEASMLSATLSSIRKVISIINPFIAGTLTCMDPRAPYITCLAFLASTIPIYYTTSKKQ